MQLLFWVLVIVSVFSYFVYPFSLSALSALRQRENEDTSPSSSSDELPHLTLIVTAYNEEKRIREKIENTLQLDYPFEKLTLIVASDCSSDETDNIVQDYADKNVVLVRAEERLGKENAQWQAIRTIDHGVIVFSDTATKIESDGLRRVAAYFKDNRVGAISSEDRFISTDGNIAGEGAYVRYEMWLRKKESQLGGLVGLSGSFFAARVEVCKKWDIHSPSDFNTALNCASLGLKAVTAPDVLGFYKDLADPSKEYARKVRTVIRGMTALARHPVVLNPFSYGLFSYQVVCHKLLRWTVPWSLLGLLVVTPFTLRETFTIYDIAMLAQIVFYGLAIATHFSERLKKSGITKIIYFFVQANIAVFDAGIKFLSGKRMTVWQPSAR